MATKAGQIVINIRAGTKSLKSDLKESSDQFNKFGREGVTGVQAVSATLRVLEGNVTNNLRAAERFLANTLKLGPVLKAAFPVVGAVAFAGVIGEMATRLGAFFKEVQQAPEKAKGAFANLNATLRVSNDGLLVSNARLKNEIAQIQGLPQNNLKVALLEAKEAADKLNESAVRALESTGKLIGEAPGGGGLVDQLKARLLGVVSTADLRKHIQGESGQGGFLASIRGLSGNALQGAYKQEAQYAADQLKQAQKEQQDYAQISGMGWSGSLMAGAVVGDRTVRIEELQAYLQQLKGLQTENTLTGANSGLNTQKAGLEDKKAAEMLDRPFTNKLAELQAELQGTREKFEGVGTAAGEVMGSGLAKAAEDIVAVNKGLEKRGPLDQMNALQALQIIFTDTAIAAAQAENAWNKEFVKTTDTIKDRISAQERLNAVIGGTYAQRKSAFVENALPGAIGAEHANDPAWMAAHPDQVAAVRGQLGQEFAGQESGKAGNALQQLSEKLRITQAMTAAAKEGAIAEQAAELAERRRLAEAAGDLGLMKEIDAEILQLAATRKKAVAQDLAEMDLQAAAMKRLAAAYGAKARLEAEAQNAKAVANRKYGDGSAAGDAAYAQVYAGDQAKVAEAAHKAASADSDHLSDLQRMKDVLSQMKVTDDNRLEIAHALRDVNDQILVATASSLEKNDSIVGGLQAGLDRIAASAETISKIVSDAMQNMVNQTSSVMADMLTGKKPKGGYGQEFGKMFQGIGHEMVQSTLKSGLSATLKHFGLAKGQLGSSPSNPIYTRSADGLPGLPGNAVPNPLGQLKTGGLFGSGSQGGGIFSMLGGLLSGAGAAGDAAGGAAGAATDVTSAISFPGMAEGGDVYPGSSYVVGDGGEPEVFSPKTAGTITPAHKIGGTNYNITVHAPNAEIGAENRIYEAVTIAHHAAVSDSVRADHELAARRPQRSKH